MLLSQPQHPHEERSWPVVLFRFKESTGWEQEVGGEKDGIATMVSPRKDRYGICRHDISLFWCASRVLTLPYVCSIVIHSLQQKFSIARTEERGLDAGGKNNNNNKKATLIRRDRCLLMLSKSRLQIMVLRFESLQDCLDFSDRFVEFNPPEDLLMMHRRRIIEDHDSQNDPRHHPPQQQPQPPQQQQEVEQEFEADRETVTAHLVRLMHDPSFTAFVRNVEEVIKNSTDGTRLLESWADTMT